MDGECSSIKSCNNWTCRKSECGRVKSLFVSLIQASTTPLETGSRAPFTPRKNWHLQQGMRRNANETAQELVQQGTRCWALRHGNATKRLLRLTRHHNASITWNLHLRRGGQGRHLHIQANWQSYLSRLHAIAYIPVFMNSVRSYETLFELYADSIGWPALASVSVNKCQRKFKRQR